MSQTRQRLHASIWIAIAAVTAASVGCFPSGANAASHAAAFTPSRFSVEVSGTGPDVILIPGLATPREVWRPSAEALKGKYRVHLIQLKGFGEAAGANVQGPVLAPFVAELARYIEANHIRRPAVIGHSMGGLAALMLAADRPALLGKVMVVDALPFIGTLFDPSATPESIRPRAEQMRSMLLARAEAAKTVTALPPRDCTGLVGEVPAMPGTMARTAKAACMIANWSAAADPNVTAQAMFDDMSVDMRARLGEIAVPLTVVFGQDERAFPPAATARFYAGAYEGAKAIELVPVGQSAHFVMLDQPEAMLAALRAFLARAR